MARQPRTVPARILDAALKLAAEGLTIDELTEEQKAYHADFSAGT